MELAKGKPFIESWSELASSILRWGDILIRFGIFLALVYGVYYAINAGILILNGSTLSIGSKPLSNLIDSIITFVCITFLSRIAERKLASGSFRTGGLVALIIGAILLVVAAVSGFVIIFGGFFVVLAVEIRRPQVKFDT
jgi:hypothetical protein